MPLVVMALLGGAIADRMDRRRLLLLDQIGLVVIASALAAVSFAGAPAVPVLYLLGALMAGFSAVQNVARSAIVPNLVAPSQVRGALALNFGLYQLTMVLGPALGGVLIAVLGVAAAYAGGDDVRNAAGAVRGALGQHLPHRRRRHRGAVRRGLGGRHSRGADDRLAGERAPPGKSAAPPSTRR